jgi:putative endonuclease
MFYIYLIESEKNERYYIGQTSNLEERIKYHNSNRSKYTKNKGPWKLIGYKKYDTRSEAMNEEKKVKGMKNREYLYNYFTES